MGSFEFELDGKVYRIATAGGVPIPRSDKEEAALDRWWQSEEGSAFLGPPPADWTKEHYLDDRYPWDRDKERRVDCEQYYGEYDEDEDENDNEDEPYIDWCEYEKCRYGCYKHFLYSGKHDCCICNIVACTPCSESGSQCENEECKNWICQVHRDVAFCPSCESNET